MRSLLNRAGGFAFAYAFVCGAVVVAGGVSACSLDARPVPLDRPNEVVVPDAGDDCPDGSAATEEAPTDCRDIDECALGIDECDDAPAASCTNMMMTYRCTCPPNTIDVGSDEPGRECERSVLDSGRPDGGGGTGGTGGSVGMRGIDECELGLDNCDREPAACVDEEFGFTCACPTGYTDPEGDGSRCENIDECAAHTDECDRTPAASCADTEGSFECTCPEGYQDPEGRVCDPICDDGLVRGLQACDDGNDDDGDGCSSTCAIEAGFTCDDNEPSECVRNCGNGARDEGESCDDSGSVSSDGCDATCAVETSTHACARFPSRCEVFADVAVIDDSSACPGAGTVASPYCSITAALASAKNIFFVRPGDYRENVSITGRTLEVFAEDGAMLNALTNDQPALRILGGANVTVTGLAIRNGASRVSVESAQATIAQAQIGPGTVGVGLISSGSAVVSVSQTRVVGNPGGGLDLAGSGAVTLVNDVVHGNGTVSAAFGGIRFASPAASSRIENVTVADNLAGVAATAGIDCGAASLPVVSSIVWGNLASVAISGVSVNCAVSYSDVEPSVAGTGNLSTDPGFVLPTYHLTGDSPALNVGDPAITTGADYDGATRPSGGRVEMGAYELSSRAPFPAGRSAQVFALDEQTAAPGPAYLGRYPVGLYPGASFVMPSEHKTAGFAAGRSVVARSVDGTPDAENGKHIFLAIGGSDVAELMCSGADDLPPLGVGISPACTQRSVIGRMQFGPGERLNREFSIVTNGAYPNQYADDFTHDDSPAFAPIPADPGLATVNGNYDRIRDRVFSEYMQDPVSEAQVQALFLEVTNEHPVASLPDRHADATELMVRLGNIVRFAKVRYPNLQVVLISSRSYAPLEAREPREPFAYETGFAVKWLIAAQIAQMRAEGRAIVDTRAGNLDYESGVAPFIAWGPYLWTHQPGSQHVGMRWYADDFEDSPTGFFSDRGESKASLQAIHHFLLSPFLKCFLLQIGSCS